MSKPLTGQIVRQLKQFGEIKGIKRSSRELMKLEPSKEIIPPKETKTIKLDPKVVNNMIKEVKFKEEKGFSRYEKPLTAREVNQLEQLNAYMGYEKLLEERCDLIIDISIKQEILANLDNSIEEYQGGLNNYRAGELNTLYSMLSKVINLTLGFVVAGIIYNGFNILKTPSLWIYLGTISVIYVLISIFEYSRYSNTVKKEK